MCQKRNVLKINALQNCQYCHFSQKLEKKGLVSKKWIGVKRRHSNNRNLLQEKKDL